MIHSKKNILEMARVFLAMFLVMSSIFILFSGCGSSKKADDLGRLQSFEYRFGPVYDNICWNYKLTIENDSAGEAQFIFQKINTNIDYIECEGVVDGSVADELSALLYENGIYHWDGFSKFDNNLCDGYGFLLNVQFENGSIAADSYGKLPKGYSKAHETLVEYLEKIAEEIDQG